MEYWCVYDRKCNMVVDVSADKSICEDILEDIFETLVAEHNDTKTLLKVCSDFVVVRCSKAVYDDFIYSVDVQHVKLVHTPLVVLNVEDL